MSVPGVAMDDGGWSADQVLARAWLDAARTAGRGLDGGQIMYITDCGAQYVVVMNEARCIAERAATAPPVAATGPRRTTSDCAFSRRLSVCGEDKTIRNKLLTVFIQVLSDMEAHLSRVCRLYSP